MERPVSIVWFERCYLGSVAVGLVNLALNWNAAIALSNSKLAENPQAAQLGASFVPTMMAGGAVLSLVISLLLWFFTARKGSVVTKWIVTVLFAYSLVMTLIGLLNGSASSVGGGGVVAVVGIVALVLNGIAVVQLFKPDTKLWFGETRV